ncbi:hypothetical protein JOE11_000766 [Robbsia andropogonis]
MNDVLRPLSHPTRGTTIRFVRPCIVDRHGPGVVGSVRWIARIGKMNRQGDSSG